MVLVGRGARVRLIEPTHLLEQGNVGIHKLQREKMEELPADNTGIWYCLAKKQCGGEYMSGVYTGC